MKKGFSDPASINYRSYNITLQSNDHLQKSFNLKNIYKHEAKSFLIFLNQAKNNTVTGAAVLFSVILASYVGAETGGPSH